jgi:hypothetical protein
MKSGNYLIGRQKPMTVSARGFLLISGAKWFRSRKSIPARGRLMLPAADEEQSWRAQWSAGHRSVLEYIEKVNGLDGLSRFKADALKRLQSQRKPEGFGQTMEALFAKATKRYPFIPTNY